MFKIVFKANTSVRDGVFWFGDLVMTHILSASVKALLKLYNYSKKD